MLQKDPDDYYQTQWERIWLTMKAIWFLLVVGAVIIVLGFSYIFMHLKIRFDPLPVSKFVGKHLYNLQILNKKRQK
jgi:hypothetical protein